MQAQRGTPVASRLRLSAGAACVVVADQLSKFAVIRRIPEGDHVRVLDNWLVISHIRNSGAAFGTLRGFPGLLALAALVGAVVFAVVVWRLPSRTAGIAASFVAGGALGNLVDRLFRGPVGRGSVVDFVDFRYWPAFNVADAAITIGALLFVWFGYQDRPQDRPKAVPGRGEGKPADSSP
jgi:signal peptidase II